MTRLLTLNGAFSRACVSPHRLTRDQTLKRAAMSCVRYRGLAENRGDRGSKITDENNLLFVAGG